MEVFSHLLAKGHAIPAYIRVVMCNHPTGRYTTEKGHQRGIVALLTIIINRTDINSI